MGAMRPAARHGWAIVAALATALGVPAVTAATEPTGAPATTAAASGPSRPDVRTVTGTIDSIAWDDDSFTLETDDGPVRLHFDRNTTVFLADRLGTVRELRRGARARTSYGAERRAFWIEVRPAESAARDRRPAEHRTAEGRPVLAAPHEPAATATGPAPTASDDTDTSGAPGDDEPPGPDAPEPNPGVTPPPPSPGPGGMPPIRALGGG